MTSFGVPADSTRARGLIIGFMDFVSLWFWIVGNEVANGSGLGHLQAGRMVSEAQRSWIFVHQTAVNLPPIKIFYGEQIVTFRDVILAYRFIPDFPSGMARKTSSGPTLALIAKTLGLADVSCR